MSSRKQHSITDPTDGWIFSTEGHRWQNEQYTHTGWTFSLLFCVKDDQYDHQQELLHGAEDTVFGLKRTSWFPGRNLVGYVNRDD